LQQVSLMFQGFLNKKVKNRAIGLKGNIKNMSKKPYKSLKNVNLTPNLKSKRLHGIDE